ncbi:Uncharacterized protein dnm_096860 [Desulfonema magnum]|uniref:Uncharacterized protein n=1 Tax=Desulfonema magnum TaxID=45655 RepID=A0A975GVP5_9BACT|nr:Uncharacterized protein dnm_096860 [Desulfonema magnum]
MKLTCENLKKRNDISVRMSGTVRNPLSEFFPAEPERAFRGTI